MRFVGVFVLGLCQGYVTPPCFLGSGVLGRWLTALWRRGELKLTAAFSSLALLVVLFSLQVLLAGAVLSQFAPDQALGRAWFVGFVVGFFLYGLLPTIEGAARKRP